MKLQTSRALNQAIAAEMDHDDSIVVFGEDMGAYGGVWGVARGLQKRFGEQRVFDTPLAETAIVGTAIGAAMAGLRPVIELMYADFVMVAMDQLVNQAGKMRLMSGGQFRLPITVVAPWGAGHGEAAQHSQALEAWFLHAPGWKVVLPSSVADMKALMTSSIRDDDPVLFLWHKGLLSRSEEVSDELPPVPLGNAIVRRSGSDVTVVAYSLMVHRAMAAAEAVATRLDVEVIDLRTVKPLDIHAVCESVNKTGRLLVVHEAPAMAGVGAEVVRQVVATCFDHLAQPPRVLGGIDLPLSFSNSLEPKCVPQVDDIVCGIETLAL